MWISSSGIVILVVHVWIKVLKDLRISLLFFRSHLRDHFWCHIRHCDLFVTDFDGWNVACIVVICKKMALTNNVFKNILNFSYRLHSTFDFQSGSEIWSFKIQTSGYSYVYGHSPDHLKGKPFKLRTILFWFQMFFDKMAAICPYLGHGLNTVCLWSKMSSIGMVRQVKWFCHLNTPYPHCLVLRWIQYSDGYCKAVKANYLVWNANGGLNNRPLG